MKRLVTFLTLMMANLAHAASPAPAVTVTLDANDRGGIRLDLTATGAEGCRVAVRHLVPSPIAGGAAIEAVPLAEIGVDPGRPVVMEHDPMHGGDLLRVRYEIETTGLQSGRTHLDVVDGSFVRMPDGRLRPITYDEELRLEPPVITLTGEPVPDHVVRALLRTTAAPDAR